MPEHDSEKAGTGFPKSMPKQMDYSAISKNGNAGMTTA
jgi:hypothetical protein